jgi:PAS domain S-box-containing protein
VLHEVNELREAVRVLRVSNQRISTGKELLKLVVDLETGLRGYVITRDPDFLEPTLTGQRAIPAAEQDFLNANAGDPEESALAGQIVAGVGEYRRWQDDQVARARRDVSEAAEHIAAGEGKRRVDALRNRFATLENRETIARDAQRAKVDSASDRAVAFVIGGMLLVCLLVILLTASLAHGVFRPIRRVAAAARHIEEGDLDTRVDEDGPGEVGTLGRSFNAMAESLRRNREDLENHNAELEAQGEELARAVAELEHEKERIETFHAVVGALSGEAELDRLAPNVLGVLRATSRADVGALYVVDPIEPARGLALSEVTGLDRSRLPETLTSGDGLAGRAAAERHPVEASHGDAGLRVSALGAEVTVRHELHLPLVHVERTLGVVTLAKVGDPPFADIDVLARMTDAAAVALDHALALEHAQHRAALMRAVLETAHDAYIAIDEDMRVSAWTPQAEALFGYAEHEIMGQPVDEFLIPERWRHDYRVAHERMLARSRRDGSARRFELPALHKSGHRLWIELSASAIQVGDGWLVNGFVRDIGARRAREHARELQRAVSQALAEAGAREDVMPRILEALGRSLHWPLAIHWVPDGGGMRCGAVWRDPELDGEELERQACDAVGTSEKALAMRACESEEPLWVALDGHDAQELPAGPAARAAGLRGALALAITCGPEGLGVLEFYDRRATPPAREVQDALQAVAGLVAEVLEPRRAEADAERLKDEFFALVLHELRTPLTSIIGYLDLVLEGEAGEISERQRRFLGVIERNARRLLRLVGDLLFAAQVEAGTLSLAHEPVDLEAVVCEAVEAGRPRAQQAQVTLTADTEPVPELDGDPRAPRPGARQPDLKRAEVHARRRRRHRGPAPAQRQRGGRGRRHRDRHSGRRAGAPVRAFLPDLERHRAFHPGDRARPVDLARHRARPRRGDLGAERRGAWYHVHRRASDHREDNADHWRVMSEDVRTVLVADDDEDILELVSFRLERAGYEVVTARDGAAAMATAQERHPDLAVLDMMMPGLNGYEVTQRLRADDATRDIPVILLTARVQEADVNRGFEAGADDYLRKPFSPQELRARVQAIIARRSRPQ